MVHLGKANVFTLTNLHRDGTVKQRKEEEKVTLVDFGTFQVMERKARRGVNPQTRQTIQIPAKKVPKFRPEKGLRKRVK